MIDTVLGMVGNKRNSTKIGVYISMAQNMYRAVAYSKRNNPMLTLIAAHSTERIVPKEKR